MFGNSNPFQPLLGYVHKSKNLPQASPRIDRLGHAKQSPFSLMGSRSFRKIRDHNTSDCTIVRKCLITLNLPKNPFGYINVGYPFGYRMMGRGLLTQVDHDAWQKRRALLNPAFHRKYLMNLMTSFNESCDLFLEKLDKMADGKTIVDMADEFARVTLDVIGKVGNYE